MDSDNLRYSGPATVRQSYMKEFQVECPKCKKDALVIVNSPYSATVLKCYNCMYLERVSDLIRFKSIVNRNCDNCGKEFEKVIANQKEKVDKITIPCPHCGITRTFKPKNEEYKIGYPDSGQANDPIFNLPLWFQGDIRGNLFWAYNRSHLEEIKSYVSSKLRERQTTTHTTMVERLPNFIKDSKNRDTLIKLIEKLERKNDA